MDATLSTVSVDKILLMVMLIIMFSLEWQVLVH